MSIQSLSFTQGGQTQLHKIRMIKQVVASTLKIALGMGVLSWFSYYYFASDFLLDILNLPAVAWAHLINAIPYGTNTIKGWCFFINQGNFIKVNASTVLHNSYCVYKVNHIMDVAVTGFFISFVIFTLSIVGSVSFFFYKGRKLKETKILGGVTLVTLKEYMKTFKKNKHIKSLEIDGIPLHKDAEVKHMMISGTTGSGKTNAMNHLLKSIRERGDKAVIVDTSGDFVAKFFNPEIDKILNPLDARSQKWNMWSECRNAFIDFDDLASDFIPETSSADSFWSTAAKQSFASIMEVLFKENNCTIDSFLELAIRMPLDQAHQKLVGTAAASYFDKNGDKMAISVRATLASHINCLMSLVDINPNDPDAFSINKWIKDENQKGFLFLCCTPKQRSYMKPLLSAWFSSSIKSLMDQGSDYNRRTWFLVDEVASLHKLRSLEMALAEARKFGGCFVLGFQNISQIETLYGLSTSKIISDLTATKMVFSTVDPYNAKKFAEMMGEQEIMEGSENVSYGAHEVRDGVSITHHKKFKPLVRHCDLNELPPLEAYIKVASINHIFKHKFSYLDLPKSAADFEKREGIQLDELSFTSTVEDKSKRTVVPVTVTMLEEKVEQSKEANTEQEEIEKSIDLTEEDKEKNKEAECVLFETSSVISS